VGYRALEINQAIKLPILKRAHIGAYAALTLAISPIGPVPSTQSIYSLPECLKHHIQIGANLLQVDTMRTPQFKELVWSLDYSLTFQDCDMPTELKVLQVYQGSDG